MRKISELIWHCTATPAGREVSVKEIDAWHKARGWSGIGYHKVVHLDGSVSEGRPESRIGAHVAGRNAGTIGYVYVGGIDANDRKKARDTRTAAQKRTMERLSREAIAKYGLTMVSGHRDYATKACPCFDARKEYAHLLTGPKDGMPDKDPAADMAELKVSRTLAGGTAVGVGSFGTAATEAAQTVQPLAEISSVLKLVFVGLTVLGIALVLYARWDDAGRPLPRRRKAVA
jgi:hypothetical protein